MGLTYDGITYRSLEEQVRYDAEQVQLLKQADVTINQNLQTVNENLQTEISGKLTKPTNPSAESAVTLLADGTVGTKPLSEIGGGGKLYLHLVPLKKSDNAIKVNVVFYSLSDQPTSDSTLIKIVKINGLLYEGADNIGAPLVGVLFANNENNFDACDFNGISLVTGQTVEATSAKFIKQNETIMEM